MTREDIEKAIYEASHNLDFKKIPWTDERVLEFVIEQITAAGGKLDD